MRPIRRLAPLAMLATVLACGGKVVWVPPGDGGASSSGSGSQTSVATGGPLEPCEALCADPACAGPSCLANCKALFGKGCDDEATALVECAATAVSTKCELEGSVCALQNQAYEACLVAQTCEDGACNIGPLEECACKGTCLGVSVEVHCAQGKDIYACDCIAGDVVVGTCFESALSCTLTNCCVTFWPQVTD